MSHDTTLKPGHYHHLEPEQAYHAAKLGMWLFLCTEVLLFGGLFLAYAVYRGMYIDMYHEYSKYLDWRLGALNTVVLLVSSFFMALAVDASQHGENRKVSRYIWVTLICAVAFLVIKAIEYHAKFEHGLFPPPNVYMGLYFTMTALHGLHVLAGMGLLWWIKGLAKKNIFSKTYYTPCEMGGLYWHLVDMIWIFLFPLLYLI